jgi:ankyrin repeat protein
MVKLLIEAGKVDINSKDKDDNTPLMLAAQEGSEDIVKLLAEAERENVDFEAG